MDGLHVLWRVADCGRTVPIKFQLTAADGTFVTTATATLQVFKVTDVVLGTVE